ncbi:MAG: DUF3299 domain-containing protein [Nannocystales bacterium]
MKPYSSPKRRRPWAPGTAILVGVSGLALAVLGPVVRESVQKRVQTSAPIDSPPPTEVRGARLDAMGSSPAPRQDGRFGGPSEARAVIPEASFELAAQLDAVASRTNGTLTFEHTSDGKYVRVPMAALASFPYDPVPHPPGAAELGIPAPAADIPPELLALGGRDVNVVGFMVPLDVDERGVKEFVLSQNRSFCCYGITPSLNEMILVRMKGGQRAPYANDTPLAVFGEFSVGEHREGGHVVSLYRMEASKITSLVGHARRRRG